MSLTEKGQILEETQWRQTLEINKSRWRDKVGFSTLLISIYYLSTFYLPPKADSCEAAVESSTVAQDARPPLVFRRDKRGRAAAEDMDTETSWEAGGAEQVREHGDQY